MENSVPPFEPACRATTIGSMPHTDVSKATDIMLKNTPEIPGWVQFPKLSYYENMMVQFLEGMPGLIFDENRTYFDTSDSHFTDQLTDFYHRYLAITDEENDAALTDFALTEKFAAGFREFRTRLQHNQMMPVALKGQITGPFTLGLNLFDQTGRCAYYDDQLRDVIIKCLSLKAMWQINALKPIHRQVLILIDEPGLINFGTQICLTVTREDIIKDLNEIVNVIHALGVWAGVHCEANTDWSLLMETDLDLLVFDAYDHFQAITLYPEQLRRFLEKGGCLGWGMVPTLDKEAAARETLSSLLVRFNDCVDHLVTMGFERQRLLLRSLITPSCGAGGVLTEALAERVLDLLHQLSEAIRVQNGLN